MPLKNIKERLNYIDLLESIAILFVILYHSTNYSFSFIKDTSNVLCYFRYFFRAILSCCVPLFFFANGYLILNKPFNLKKHIKKTIRLSILTILWAIIELFILMFITNKFFTVKQFFIGVWTLKQGWINHLWYMEALVVIYLLLPLIKFAYDKKRDLFNYFIIVVAIFTFGNVFTNIVASITSHFILGKSTIYSLNWFNGFNPLRGIYGYSFVYFCLGGIADQIVNKFKYLKRTTICLCILILSTLGLFITGVLLTYTKGKTWDIVYNGYDTIFTLINVICIYSLCLKYKGNNKFLNNIFYIISSNTLGIYFIHLLFIQLFRPYVEKMTILSNVPGNIIYSLIILIISLGVTLIIKKIPLIKRLVM